MILSLFCKGGAIPWFVNLLLNLQHLTGNPNALPTSEITLVQYQDRLFCLVFPVTGGFALLYKH